MQQTPGMVQMILVGGATGSQAYRAGSVAETPRVRRQPFLAVGAVVGQGLAGPLAGDQDPPPGVAEVISTGGPCPCRAPGVRPGRAFLGWMPYRSQLAHRGEHGLMPQGLGQPSGVVVLRGRW